MFATFYHNTTRNTVIAFGNLFNNIYYVKYNKNGTENRRIKVPIDYSPKQKWWRAVKETGSGTDNEFKSSARILPRMSFEITNIQPDFERKSQLARNLYNTSEGIPKHIFAPTPYKYSFELNVMVENSAEGFQIIEQILPFFNPTLNVTVNSLPEIGYKEDLSLTLNSVIKNDEYSGDFETMRIQTWSISFDMRINLYGEIKDANLIKKAITHINIVNTNGDGSGEITQEQMDESAIDVIINTEPDPLNADPQSDYGFSISVEYPDSPVEFDPETGTYVPKE